MNSGKTGFFIKNLREKSKMSQEELANKMMCDRTKINKIERGSRTPQIDDLIILTKIFNISIEELIAGDFKKKETKKEIEITFMQYLKSQSKQKKKLKITIIVLTIILILFILFFGIYYFIQNYSSIRVYKFYGNSENYEMDNGILIISKDRIYMKIGDINSDVDNISIYSKLNKTTKLVYEGEPDAILYDFYGYEGLISYSKFIKGKQKIYILINGEKINLNFDELFKNDKLVYQKKKKIGSGNNNSTISIPQKVKDKFDCNNDSCSLTIRNENLLYSNNIFIVSNKNETYQFDMINNILNYQDSSKTITINVVENNPVCISDNCDDMKNIYNKFYNNYILKYLK